jgi:hypothetical protein
VIFSTFILKPGLLHEAEPFRIALGKVSAYETPKGIVVVLRNLWDQVLLFQPFSGPLEASVALSPTLSPVLFDNSAAEKTAFLFRVLRFSHLEAGL